MEGQNLALHFKEKGWYTVQWTELCLEYTEQWDLYRMSQEWRSLLRDLIPELILSQKLHIHMGPIHNGSGAMSV